MGVCVCVVKDRMAILYEDIRLCQFNLTVNDMLKFYAKNDFLKGTVMERNFDKIEFLNFEAKI